MKQRVEGSLGRLPWGRRSCLTEDRKRQILAVKESCCDFRDGLPRTVESTDVYRRKDERFVSADWPGSPESSMVDFCRDDVEDEEAVRRLTFRPVDLRADVLNDTKDLFSNEVFFEVVKK